MTSLCMKRLTKERERFTTDDSEFWVNWKDTNLRKFEAYIVGPTDSVYKHKLIKLQFDVPDNYPIVPPKVKFIQHTGDRIHPNLYVDGKVCLSILSTWSGPGWAQNMNIESILRTLRSLLDYKPYMHEPSQADNPAFNNYVRYHGWRWLLLDYLERETDLEAKGWLDKFTRKNSSNTIVELERQRDAARYASSSMMMSSPYAPGSRHTVDYPRLLSDLKMHIPYVPETRIEDGFLGPAMEDARAKRKLHLDYELPKTAAATLPSPAKKQHVANNLHDGSERAASSTSKPTIYTTEIIDLTDD